MLHTEKLGRAWRCSLVPRPHPQGGKGGLVNMDTILGPGKGIWAFQSDCSFSTVIWLTNRRHHCLLHCWIASLPLRSLADQSDQRFALAQVCWRMRSEPAKPRKWSKFTRPYMYFLARGRVWAWDYWRWGYLYPVPHKRVSPIYTIRQQEGNHITELASVRVYRSLIFRWGTSHI